jgi:hemerythrin
MLLQWHEEYRVNILRVDNQHRRLFEQGNAILDAIQCNRAIEEVIALFDAMAEYARYHFGEEEGMMGRHNYPELDNHRAMHARLIDQIDGFRFQMFDTEQVDEAEILHFLQDWLVTHILTEDRKYAPFMNERGVY